MTPPARGQTGAARLVLTRLLVLVLTRRLLHQHPDRRAFAPVASAVRA
jgi:hypothetical protein